MTIFELLKKKLIGRDLNALAGELGYGNREKGAQRIQRLLESDNLGVDQSGYDFKYSSKELLLKLCELLDMDQRFYEEGWRLIQAELLIEEQRFKPYIFIETGFKRDGESVSTLGYASRKRYIRIDDEIGRLPLRQQLPLVKEFVRSHYARPHGKVNRSNPIYQPGAVVEEMAYYPSKFDEDLPLGILPVWGKIQSYIYHYSETVIFEINPDGWVVGTLAKNDSP
ncbi:MAG: hypothetical protein HGA96_04285 [Desulfobulbaceae bacterium]|nr:hypothetical protein [Desulfobulbaceae bacterium]